MSTSIKILQSWLPNREVPGRVPIQCSAFFKESILDEGQSDPHKYMKILIWYRFTTVKNSLDLSEYNKLTLLPILTN